MEWWPGWLWPLGVGTVAWTVVLGSAWWVFMGLLGFVWFGGELLDIVSGYGLTAGVPPLSVSVRLAEWYGIEMPRVLDFKVCYFLPQHGSTCGKSMRAGCLFVGVP